MIHLAYCTKCGKQGVGSTEHWKTSLSNFKSHITKKVKLCSIVKRFIDFCTDTVNPFKYVRFILQVFDRGSFQVIYLVLLSIC